MTKRKPVFKGTFAEILDDNWDEIVAAFPDIDTIVEEYGSVSDAAMREYETAAFNLARVKGRRSLQGQDQGLTDLRERLNARTREARMHTHAEIIRLLKTRYIVKLDEPPEE